MYKPKYNSSDGSFKTTFTSQGDSFRSGIGKPNVIYNGQNGATFYPNVSPQGILSWTNDRELENPPPVNIKGADGKDGKDGIDGKDGFNGIDGKDGVDGANGKDGFSPLVSVTDIEGGHKVTITDKEGEKTFDVMDGKDGQGGGGVTSWNDLTDKPFSDEFVSFDITWDGDMTGHEVFDNGDDSYYVKVSDDILTKEQLLNAHVGSSDGYARYVAENDISESPGMIDLGGGMICVIYSASELCEAWGLPEGSVSNGVWFIHNIDVGFYTNRLTDAIIKPLSSIYLSDYIVNYDGLYATLADELYWYDQDIQGRGYQTEEQVNEALNDVAKTKDLSAVATSGSWNDLTDKPFGAVGTLWGLVASSTTSSDKSITLSFRAVEGKNYKLEVVAQLTNMVLASNIAPCVAAAMGWYTIGNYQDAVYCEIFDMACTIKWNVSSPYGYRVNVYEEQETIATLDEKYLPDSVVLESELTAKGYQTESQVTALIDQAIANLPRYKGEVEEI